MVHGTPAIVRAMREIKERQYFNIPKYQSLYIFGLVFGFGFLVHFESFVS